jgi:hypothetical protein
MRREKREVATTPIIHTISSSVALFNFLGRVIAKLYLPLEMRDTMVTRDKKVAKIPKSEGVYNLVNIGVTTKGITCERVFPIEKVTKSLRNELAGRYFSFNLIKKLFIFYNLLYDKSLYISSTFLHIFSQENSFA